MLGDGEQIPETFLEPVYLNEKMVLNCAAYLFGGYALDAEIVEKGQAERSKSFKAGLSFLEKFVSLGGEGQWKDSQVSENKSARRYTVGGLHMSLIDELRARNMLQAVRSSSLEEDLQNGSSYVEVRATLRPVQFYSVIDTLRIASPIVEELLKSFVKPLYEQRNRTSHTLTAPTGKGNNKGYAPPQKQGSQKNQWELFLDNSSAYSSALQSVLTQLENDYRRSKQFELVMWPDGARAAEPFGVVDLDVTGYEIEELRAKLSEGTFHVIGKVTRSVGERESINLLQKSVLYSTLSLFDRLVSASSIGAPESFANYRQGMQAARSAVERIGLLQVPGPAVRIAAMSVCI